ncbi:DUF2691 family protein [Clostridium felsineum]|uniref:Uncharacterized protein n=1 Tax=Clostridium felsineum TaxID=36839 RepID=A0A1S8LA26_9CLOT|nr:DUF2691 family protein [Clostridium felsineum]URZ06114.1 hypothetical protein CLROS_014470 [Clostridium felsineum]URZ11151.1 hypothetical protein CROST_018680 [Clostridium felsineum]
MKNMGISFEIPNNYGSYLSDILEPLGYSDYKWLIDDDEIHLMYNNEFTDEFLFNDSILSGEELYSISKNNTYYMVFATLRAFYKESTVKKVLSYNEFLKSDCKIIIGIYDCSEVILLSKDTELIARMYDYTLYKGFKKVEYISEEELIAGKYHID